MTLETEAISIATSFSQDTSLGGTAKERAKALSDAAKSLFPDPVWRKLPVPSWPNTVAVIRGSNTHNGKMIISTGGTANLDAQAWYWDGTAWMKHSHFNNYRMNVLTKDAVNNIIMGLGSQHVSGSARVWKYDGVDPNVNSQVGANFSGQDIIYSMAWLGSDLYCGTLAEDVPGSARVKKLVSGAWVDDFAPGINGVPASYTYCAFYELWTYGGKLYGGTFSRTPGDGHIWRRDAAGWVCLGAAVPVDYILAATEYDGKMVVSTTTNGNQHPVHYYNGSAWVALGNTPAEWTGATIFNHMAVFKGKLYMTSGGVAGKLGVWRLDDGTWVKVGGNGVPNSFTAPIAPNTPSEWGYRLQEWNDKLHMCVASSVPGSACVFEMSL